MFGWEIEPSPDVFLVPTLRLAFVLFSSFAYMYPHRELSAFQPPRNVDAADHTLWYGFAHQMPSQGATQACHRQQSPSWELLFWSGDVGLNRTPVTLGGDGFYMFLYIAGYYDCWTGRVGTSECCCLCFRDELFQDHQWLCSKNGCVQAGTWVILKDFIPFGFGCVCCSGFPIGNEWLMNNDINGNACWGRVHA